LATAQARILHPEQSWARIPWSAGVQPRHTHSEALCAPFQELPATFSNRLMSDVTVPWNAGHSLQLIPQNASMDSPCDDAVDVLGLSGY